MCSLGTQTDGGGSAKSEDLLERILREFDEHCGQLEPMADEYKRVMAAREALAAGMASQVNPEPRPPRRVRPSRRRRPDDGELLEAVYEQVRRYPGVTPAQLAQVLGYSSGERARLVIRPLSRLHRLGRIERDGEGFRVAEGA
ncbi:MAG: hypothetical protein ITG02_07555 [Patulibacter sp.]|nr:hypothetical protein [Patulibacter sp.]